MKEFDYFSKSYSRPQSFLGNALMAFVDSLVTIQVTTKSRS